MATRDDAKQSEARKNEFSWEDFRPEWANEGIERISQELEKWNDDLQTRSANFRKQSQERIDKSVAQIQEELRKLPGAKRVEKIRSDLGKRVEKRVEEGVDRVYTIFDEASRSGRLQPGQLVSLTAFGSGFTWGSAIIRWG